MKNWLTMLAIGLVLLFAVVLLIVVTKPETPRTGAERQEGYGLRPDFTLSDGTRCTGDERQIHCKEPQ